MNDNCLYCGKAIIFTEERPVWLHTETFQQFCELTLATPSTIRLG